MREALLFILTEKHLGFIDVQAVPAAQEVTDLPIISDPSHATFWEPWVEPKAKFQFQRL